MEQKHTTLHNCLVYAEFVVNFLGIVGNFLIIITMRKSTVFAKMPRSLICVTLAAVDILYFVYFSIDNTFVLLYGRPLMLINRVSCKVAFSAVFFIIHLDAWLLVLLALERFLCIMKPLKIATIETKSRIKIVLILQALFFAIWNAETGLRKDLISMANGTIESCVDRITYGLNPQIFHTKDFITELFCTFIPGGIIAVANSILIFNIFKQRNERNKLTNYGSRFQKETNDDVIKITWMMSSVTSAFLVFLIPTSTYIMINGYNFNDPLFLIFGKLPSLNFACNFYFYFATASLFRQEVRKVFCSFKPSKNREIKK